MPKEFSCRSGSRFLWLSLDVEEFIGGASDEFLKAAGTRFASAVHGIQVDIEAVEADGLVFDAHELSAASAALTVIFQFQKRLFGSELVDIEARAKLRGVRSVRRFVLVNLEVVAAATRGRRGIGAPLRAHACGQTS